MAHGHRKQIVHGRSQMGLSTLASGSVIEGTTKIDAAREQGVKITKLMAACDFTNKTSDEGPLVVGYAIGNMTAAEIAEALAADPQLNDDDVASEQANRKVVPVWYIAEQPSDNEDAVMKLEEISVPWDIAEGEAFTWWTLNNGPDTLTTGTIVNVWTTLVGEWLRD